MLHKYGTARNFNIMEPVFLEQGIQRNIRVGSSEIRLVNVKGMVRTTTFALRANPHILCAK
jgi:aminoglycoside N3'-acetyltransferase